MSLGTHLLRSALLLGLALPASCCDTGPSDAGETVGASKASAAGDAGNKRGKKGRRGGDKGDRGGQEAASGSSDSSSTGSRATGAHAPAAIRFGINGVHYPAARKGEAKLRARTAELGELGPVWLRHPGHDTGWFEIQSERGGPYKWTKLDVIIEENEHPWVMEIYGSIGTVYPFRTDLSRDKLKGDRKEAFRQIKENSINWDSQQERDDAEAYVKAFVNRYKHKVRVWEIGNEGINSVDRFETIKYTYGWIKEAYPEATVMITAVAGDDDELFERGVSTMDSLLERGAGAYFDVGNFHYYGRADGNFEQRLEERYDSYQSTLERHGVDKPIWVTETATSSVDGSAVSGPTSERIQARHMVKRLVVFSAKGAEKVFWHGYRSAAAKNKFNGCNLIDDRSDSRKPAYRTFKLIVDKIGDYEAVETVSNDGLWLYRFTRPGGKVVMVAWASSEKTVDMSEHLGTSSARLTHIIDNSSSTASTESVKSSKVSVGASPIFVEPA